MRQADSSSVTHVLRASLLISVVLPSSGIWWVLIWSISKRYGQSEDTKIEIMFFRILLWRVSLSPFCVFSIVLFDLPERGSDILICALQSKMSSPWMWRLICLIILKVTITHVYGSFIYLFAFDGGRERQQISHVLHLWEVTKFWCSWVITHETLFN